MAGKWLEVLKETAPGPTRAMAIVDLETPAHQAMWNAIRDAAPRLGVEVTAVGVHDAAEIERATASFALKENGGIILLPQRALRHRMPAIYATEGSVTSGRLVSCIAFGRRPNMSTHSSRHKTGGLAGAAAQQKAIGVGIAPTLLKRADEVIE